MARAVADAGSLLVVSSNAGSTFERIAATGVAWWLQMYVTADRAPASRSCSVPWTPVPGAVVPTADTPVVGTKYGDGPTIWDVAEPGWCGRTSTTLAATSRAWRRPRTWGPTTSRGCA